jgi:hypothetical protein
MYRSNAEVAKPFGQIKGLNHGFRTAEIAGGNAVMPKYRPIAGQ